MMCRKTKQPCPHMPPSIPPPCSSQAGKVPRDCCCIIMQSQPPIDHSVFSFCLCFFLPACTSSKIKQRRCVCVFPVKTVETRHGTAGPGAAPAKSATEMEGELLRTYCWLYRETFFQGELFSGGNDTQHGGAWVHVHIIRRWSFRCVPSSRTDCQLHDTSVFFSSRPS